MCRRTTTPLTVATATMFALIGAAVALYAGVSRLPHAWRPRVDTVTLPRLETWLFGRYVGTMIERSTWRDIAAGVPYALHFALPFLFFGAALVAHYRLARRGTERGMTPIEVALANKERSRVRPISFVCALVSVTLLGNIAQIVLPTAAPWYTAEHGHAEASYSMRGNIAGLAGFDAALNTTFFRDLFAANSIVYGSMPSIHVAWPLVVYAHQWTRLGRALSIAHVAWISVSVLYLTHHYILDLAGAYLFVVAGIWLARLLVAAAIAALTSSESSGWRNLVLFEGGRLVPLTAPDVFEASMLPTERQYWAPDLGDLTPAWAGALAALASSAGLSTLACCTQCARSATAAFVAAALEKWRYYQAYSNNNSNAATTIV